MIFLDANILLYAYDSSSPFHPPARRWLASVLSRPEPVGLPWATLLAFLRISTNPRAFAHPLTTLEAVAIVSKWLEQPTVVVPPPTERHWPILSRILAETRTRGPGISDAHLAALTLEHGAILCTTDRDFKRYPGLKTLNPIEP